MKALVKPIVLRHAPDAEIILFGSRARGDAQPDSDWDFLVLLGSAPTPVLRQTILDALYDLELEINEMISTIFRAKEKWDSALFQATPLHKNVTREGILL